MARYVGVGRLGQPGVPAGYAAVKVARWGELRLDDVVFRTFAAVGTQTVQVMAKGKFQVAPDGRVVEGTEDRVILKLLSSTLAGDKPGQLFSLRQEAPIMTSDQVFRAAVTPEAPPREPQTPAELRQMAAALRQQAKGMRANAVALRDAGKTASALALDTQAAALEQQATVLEARAITLEPAVPVGTIALVLGGLGVLGLGAWLLLGQKPATRKRRAYAMAGLGRRRRTRTPRWVQRWISQKIRHLIKKEGYPSNQAAAIAYSMARRAGMPVAPRTAVAGLGGKRKYVRC